eukprot:10748397-Alexandrium_andersonii.AAC.1
MAPRQLQHQLLFLLNQLLHTCGRHGVTLSTAMTSGTYQLEGTRQAWNGRACISVCTVRKSAQSTQTSPHSTQPAINHPHPAA